MIEKEKVLTWLEICGKNRDCSGCCPYGNGVGEDNMSRCREDLMADALSLLKEQETVVRCKDCKYWLPMNRFDSDYHPGRGQCEWNCWVRDFDWFCADGEKR